MGIWEAVSLWEGPVERPTWLAGHCSMGTTACDRNITHGTATGDCGSAWGVGGATLAPEHDLVWQASQGNSERLHRDVWWPAVDDCASLVAATVKQGRVGGLLVPAASLGPRQLVIPLGQGSIGNYLDTTTSCGVQFS
jgi:hypothetical protein